MALSAQTVSQNFATGIASARAIYPIVHDGKQLFRVHNASAGIAFVRSGDVTVVATGTDQYIPANGSIVICRDVKDTNLAAILSVGTGVLYFAPTESSTTSVG